MQRVTKYRQKINGLVEENMMFSLLVSGMAVWYSQLNVLKVYQLVFTDEYHTEEPCALEGLRPKKVIIGATEVQILLKDLKESV